MAYDQGISGGTGVGANVGSFALTFPNPQGSPLAAGQPAPTALCLVAKIAFKGTVGTGLTIALSDTSGNTWTPLFYNTPDPSIFFGAWVCLAPVIPSGATLNTVTATCSGTMELVSMTIEEYSQIAAVDVFASGVQSLGNPPGGAITTTHSQDTILAFAATLGQTTRIPFPFFSPGPALTFRSNAGGAATMQIQSYDAQVSVADDYTVTFGYHRTGTFPDVYFGIVALKAVTNPLAATTAWMQINEPVLGLTDRSALLHMPRGKSKHKFTNTLQERGTADVACWLSASNTYDPTQVRGCQVYFYDQTPAGSMLVWAGEISKVTIVPRGTGGARVATLTLTSFRRCFDRILVRPQLFQSQTAGAIFSSLFKTEAGGVPVALGAVVGSGSGPTGAGANFVIDTLDLSAGWARLSEVYDDLGKSAGCIWDVDLATLSAYFKPPSTTAAPYALTPRQLLYPSASYNLDDSDFRTKQVLRISADAFAPSAEAFAFSGVPASFVLARPASKILNAWLINGGAQNHATGTFTGNPSPGDTITIGYPQQGSIYNWAPNSPYQVGQVIVDPSNHIQRVTTAGTSGSSQPSWDDAGGTTSDGPGSNPQPGFNGGVIWQDEGVSGPGGIGATTYTFVSQIDNAQWGQVLIDESDPTGGQTCQNFADAINCTFQTALGQQLQGQTFSWPTWENPMVNAQANGATLSIQNKPVGSGYISSLAASSGAFSWSGSQTSGGATGPTYSLQIAENGSSNTANLYYTPGSAVVAIASNPTTHSVTQIQIQYQRQAGDCIIVENTAMLNQMAAIEGGNGRFEVVLTDTSITSNTEGLQYAQSIVAAFSQVPVSLSFSTFKPGLVPGQLLTIALVNPANMAVLWNGTFFVQEVSGELISIRPAPYMDQVSAPGGGHYRYTVTCINAAQILSWLGFWQQQLGGGGGGGSAGLISAGASLGNSASASGVSGLFVMGTAGNLTPLLSAGFLQATGSSGTIGPLTGAAHILPPASIPANTGFMVQIRQPVSGSGFNVTWDSFYKGVPAAGFGIDPTPNTVANFFFYTDSAGATAQLLFVMNGGSTQ